MEASEAVNLPCSFQANPSKRNAYIVPEKVPSSLACYAPITATSPLIETEKPNQSPA